MSSVVTGFQSSDESIERLTDPFPGQPLFLRPRNFLAFAVAASYDAGVGPFGSCDNICHGSVHLARRSHRERIGGFFVPAFFWRPSQPRGRLTPVEPSRPPD
jgi:hypothetical protein